MDMKTVYEFLSPRKTGGLATALGETSRRSLLVRLKWIAALIFEEGATTNTLMVIFYHLRAFRVGHSEADASGKHYWSTFA